MLKPAIRLYLDPPKKVRYSHIVNRSQYRPDNIVKHELDSGQTPSIQGQFDGNWTDIECDSVPNEAIWLRENRLDRTEVEELRNLVIRKAQKDATDLDIIKANAISKAQSEKIGKLADMVLGE